LGKSNDADQPKVEFELGDALLIPAEGEEVLMLEGK
jgi:hypothetical protein